MAGRPRGNRKIFGNMDLGGPVFCSCSATAAGRRPARRYPPLSARLSDCPCRGRPGANGTFCRQDAVVAVDLGWPWIAVGEGSGQVAEMRKTGQPVFVRQAALSPVVPGPVGEVSR